MQFALRASSFGSVLVCLYGCPTTPGEICGDRAYAGPTASTETEGGEAGAEAESAGEPLYLPSEDYLGTPYVWGHPSILQDPATFEAIQAVDQSGKPTEKQQPRNHAPAGAPEGDARVPVVGEFTLQSYPYRATGRLEVEWTVGATTSGFVGSAFLVGPRHILTNWHVINGPLGGGLDLNEGLIDGSIRITFHPGRGGAVHDLPEYNGGPWSAEVVVPPKELVDGEFFIGDDDYALLVLEDDPVRLADPNLHLGWYQMCSPSLDDLRREGRTLSVMGYPGDDGDENSLDWPDSTFLCANSPETGVHAGHCAGWMYRTPDTSLIVDDSNSRLLRTTGFTQRGTSGGPLLTWGCTYNSPPEDKPCAVGVNKSLVGSFIDPTRSEINAVRLTRTRAGYLRESGVCAYPSLYHPAPDFCP